MTIRTSYANREEWLAARADGLGGSDIGAIIGVSGFKSSLQLWREKIGAVKGKELSDNPRVQFGNDAEEPLRAMFRVMHPEYELTFEPYTILRQSGRYSFLFCTPDGELVERSTGRKGLYESKTATCIKKADWEKWKGRIPDTYYAQICDAIFAGDFDFAVVWALLRNLDGGGELRFYLFERTDCEEDINWLLPKAEAFWKHITDGTMPSQTLIL